MVVGGGTENEVGALVRGWVGGTCGGRGPLRKRWGGGERDRNWEPGLGRNRPPLVPFATSGRRFCRFLAGVSVAGGPVAVASPFISVPSSFPPPPAPSPPSTTSMLARASSFFSSSVASPLSLFFTGSDGVAPESFVFESEVSRTIESLPRAAIFAEGLRDRREVRRPPPASASPEATLAGADIPPASRPASMPSACIPREPRTKVAQIGSGSVKYRCLKECFGLPTPNPCCF